MYITGSLHNKKMSCVNEQKYYNIKAALKKFMIYISNFTYVSLRISRDCIFPDNILVFTHLTHKPIKESEH
jgi:predicted small integral membrane protein